MKNQALVSSKDKSKKLECRLLQFLFGALRVKKKTVLVNLYHTPYDSPHLNKYYWQIPLFPLFHSL